MVWSQVERCWGRGWKQAQKVQGLPVQAERAAAQLPLKRPATTMELPWHRSPIPKESREPTQGTGQACPGTVPWRLDCQPQPKAYQEKVRKLEHQVGLRRQRRQKFRRQMQEELPRRTSPPSRQARLKRLPPHAGPPPESLRENQKATGSKPVLLDPDPRTECLRAGRWRRGRLDCLCLPRLAHPSFLSCLPRRCAGMGHCHREQPRLGPRPGVALVRMD